jgi:hypothetical protein
MDTASAPIENQAEGVSQPSPETNVAPLNPINDEVAAGLKGFDIKGADLSSLGLDPLAGKYKTVADLEKSYSHLQQKFGSFAGAPEEYQAPEGVEVGEWLQEWGKEAGLNQEGFETLVSKYNEVQAEQQEQFLKEEIAKLGNNASTRIDNLRDWGVGNGIDAATMDSLFQSAAHVEALEALMNSSGVVAPADAPASQPAITNDYLSEITYAKDQYGRLKTESDPEYAKFVQEAWAKKR